MHDQQIIDPTVYNQETAHLGIRFYTEAVEHRRKTVEKGRPVFVDVEMMEVRFPGGKESMVVRAHSHAMYYYEQPGAVGESITYAQKYSLHFKRWKELGENTVIGTPIAEATFLTSAGKSTCKALGVLSVEQLAALDGKALVNLGPAGSAWKENAIKLLTATEKNSSAIAMQSKFDEQAAEMELLRKEMMELKAGAGGDATATVEPVKVEAAPATPSNQFDNMSKDELKDFIKARTGARPLGNPAIATLQKQAAEVEAAETV